MKKNNLTKLIIFIIISALFITGCGSSQSGLSIGASDSNGGDSASSASGNDSTEEKTGTRDATPIVRVPEAPGTEVFSGKVSEIDISNIASGYFMVKYTGDKERVKMQLTHNGSEPYTYDLSPGGDFETFALTTGDGEYTLTINENIKDDSYAVIDTAVFSVTLEDEFGSFLYPNQYVNFTPDSAIVPLSEELAVGASDDLDVISSVYDYVTANIEYDYELAETVSTFYLPDVDATLDTKKGLCFDYAALMTSMLRAQRIPTQLVIGYAGNVYHAWISVYTPETGWMNDLIEFNGDEWERLDPTFASTSNNSSDAAQYVGDGSNYNALFFY